MTSMTANGMTAVRADLSAHTVTVEHVPIPEPGEGEIRIAVKAAGVCLSDVHLVDGSIAPQFLDGSVVTLGHEVAGIVDSLGPGVTGPEVGTRVLLQAGHQTPRVGSSRKASITTAATRSTRSPVPRRSSPSRTPCRSSRRPSSPTPCPRPGPR